MRCALGWLACAAVACTPPLRETATGQASVIVLGQSWELHARSYVMIDPGAPESGVEALAHYERFVQANNRALQWDVQRLVGPMIALGSPEPSFLQRQGDRYAYDFDMRVALLGTNVAGDHGIAWTESGATFDVLRRLRTNEGLLDGSAVAGSELLPDLLHTTTTTPHGFDRMPVSLTAHDDSEDAWPDYAGLFGDGVLDVDVHFGVVAEAGEHMRAARAYLDWLRGQGYVRARASASSMAGEPTSGPWVRTIQTPNGPVTVEVRVVFGRSWTPSDPTSRAGALLLAERARQSLATRDAVVFIGHDYGDDSFWTTGSLGDNEHLGIAKAEFGTLPLAGRSQVIVSEGCWTAVLGETLVANPTSAGGSRLDLVASANAAFINSDHVARSTLDLLASTDEREQHVPRRYLATLFAMQLEHPMEGAEETLRLVELLDDNPRRHPYVDPAVLGRPCGESAECGVGAACLTSYGERTCTPECGSSAGCADGRACRWDPAIERPNVQNDPRTPRYCLDPR